MGCRENHKTRLPQTATFLFHLLQVEAFWLDQCGVIGAKWKIICGFEGAVKVEEKKSKLWVSHTLAWLSHNMALPSNNISWPTPGPDSDAKGPMRTIGRKGLGYQYQRTMIVFTRKPWHAHAQAEWELRAIFQEMVNARSKAISRTVRVAVLQVLRTSPVRLLGSMGSMEHGVGGLCTFASGFMWCVSALSTAD